jgi:hypothetical protein
VLFAAGILTYFGLDNESDPRVAVALVLAALGRLVIVALGLALAPAANRPDMLIERDGATAALRSDDGSLVFPPATAATYSVENWLLADGDDRDAEAASGEGRFPLRSVHRHGQRQDRGARPPSRRARGGLPRRRYRHRALHGQQEMPRRAGHRRPADAKGRRRPRALYRGPVHPHRDGCRFARAAALGARSRTYPANARSNESDEAGPRLDGKPDE